MNNVKGNVKLWGATLAFAIFLMSVAVGQCGCGGEKETPPCAQPNTPKAPTVTKPTVAGADLTPKGVTASKTESGSDPMRATDGDITTAWAAGEVAPQWIQLDLGEPASISAVLLDTNQTPDGPTTHQIYGGSSADNLKLLGTLDGN